MKNEGNYQIALTSEAAVPQKSIVGEVTAPEKTFRCELIVDDHLVAKYEMNEVFVTLLPTKPLELPQYKIIFSDEFLKKLQRRDATSFFKLYREIGHIHNLDLIKDKDEEEEKNRNGEPSEADLAADRFAMSYMGFSYTLAGLKAIRKERKALYESLACAETKEQRKQALDEIDKRIEILCNDSFGN